MLLMFLCASSCGSETDPITEDAHAIKKETSQDVVWVCHHPGSKYHDLECVEKVYPDGCYVEGDNHKFCWLLQRSDCSKQSSLSACKIFDESDW